MTTFELILAAGLGAVTMVLLASWMKQETSLYNTALFNGQVEMELANAIQLIKRVGRASEACTKVNSADGTGLECRIYFGAPTGPESFVRFLLTPEPINERRLLYQRRDPLDPDWQQRADYPNIKEFTVCDDNDMFDDFGADPPTCALEPREFYRLIPDPDANRMFRVQISDSRGHHYPGAFYLRNPTPLGITYSYIGGFN